MGLIFEWDEKKFFQISKRMFMQITISLPQNKLSAFRLILDGFKEAKVITDFISTTNKKSFKSNVKHSHFINCAYLSTHVVP